MIPPFSVTVMCCRDSTTSHPGGGPGRSEELLWHTGMRLGALIP